MKATQRERERERETHTENHGKERATEASEKKRKEGKQAKRKKTVALSHNERHTRVSGMSSVSLTHQQERSMPRIIHSHRRTVVESLSITSLSGVNGQKKELFKRRKR